MFLTFFITFCCIFTILTNKHHKQKSTKGAIYLVYSVNTAGGQRGKIGGHR